METPRRSIKVTSSLNEISMGQLGKGTGKVRGVILIVPTQTIVNEL
jgi:hypothetical protein